MAPTGTLISKRRTNVRTRSCERLVWPVLFAVAGCAGPSGQSTPAGASAAEAGRPMIDSLERGIASNAADVSFAIGAATFQLVRVPAGDFYMGSPVTEPGHGTYESP